MNAIARLVLLFACAPGKDGIPGKYKPLPVALALYNLRADLGDKLTKRTGDGTRETGR